MAIINPGCVTEGDAGTNHATSKDKDKEGLAELAEKSNAVRRFKKGKASDLRSAGSRSAPWDPEASSPSAARGAVRGDSSRWWRRRWERGGTEGGAVAVKQVWWARGCDGPGGSS